MTDYAKALAALNQAQRKAVTTIEGPVLVVAGPGTGKTQLLSVRAAHIVAQTDTAPNNILCLTFTESAALAMRKRLADLMGPEGSKIVVHTFHSFGAEIIQAYPEYFYNGARFSPADELTSYELLQDIFADLPHSNPLAKTMGDAFTALPDAQRAISHLKRAGMLPQELRAILAHNQEFCDFAEPLFAAAFDGGRLSKKDFPAMHKLASELASFTPTPLAIPLAKPLSALATAEFETALNMAEETGKTTALTAWRNHWLEKNHRGQLVCKDRHRAMRLKALADIYETYRAKLLEQQLFDFDDMVSTVAHTLETTPELRFNLQEQFLYLMVDEFQDSNGAQLRLLGTLTSNPASEGRPNILAVGDDDQAIYAFQGAELSNILDFKNLYRDPTIVTLTDNYRSTAPVLQTARGIITQAEERLETTLDEVNKELTAHSRLKTIPPALHEFNRPEEQFQWVVDDIKQRLAGGTPPDEMAILARNHKQLLAALPYLHAAGVPVQYERRSNVLESPHIRELVTLAEVVVAIGEQRYDIAEGLLPELLSYNFWGLKTSTMWQLSLDAHKQRRMWLELMIDSDGPLRAIAEFLVVAATRALHEPCDIMLDMLIGTTEQQVGDAESSEPLTPGLGGPPEEYISPYRAYYFNEQRLQANASEYLALLGNLRTLRNALHHYRPGETLVLRSFIDFVELHQQTNIPIVDTGHQLPDTAGVNLMTAHKAKGLEFNTVYILSCQDDIWGRKTRTRSTSLGFPLNLPIEPVGQRYDDALRLFYVAATRAKQHLILTSYTHESNGKETLRASFLQELTATTHDKTNPLDHLEQYMPGWHTRHLSLPRVKRETLLRPALDTYALSATHLNNFLDVTRGGPQAFLLQNLLRFPQAMTTHQVFGHAVHAVLQRAHTHLAATGERRPLEDILHDFELQLQHCRLGEREFAYLLEKGSDVLQTYLATRHQHFRASQRAERDFRSQHVVINGVRITGTIDVMDINQPDKTVVITDYKTGKSLGTWRPTGDFDKIRLHKYKQQLMLYQLLIEHARDFAGYTVERGVLEFVEADGNGELHRLDFTPSTDELNTFRTLLHAVWEHIQTLTFPDTSHYPPNYSGLLQFEEDLCTPKN